MTTIDFFLLALLAIGAIRGYIKGFVNTLFTLGGFLIGLIVAYLINGELGSTLAPHIDTDVNTARVICFFLLWIVIPVGLGVVGQMMTKMIGLLKLGFINRLGGAAIGIIKYFMLATCLVAFCAYTKILPEQRAASPTCQFMQDFASSFVKAVPKQYKNGY
ncbi:MAG: CvpA family protein [Bacteroidaceae bacterium]|nr:CvpA family protein [Bacteroidaceae bacterium]